MSVEFRWLVTREQEAGAFSEPIPWPDGSTVYARLQHREKQMLPGSWMEIPVVSEVKDAPRISLVPSGSRLDH